MSVTALVLTASIASYHLDRDFDYNEFNPGVGLEVHLDNDFHLGVGGYKNSYYTDTYYIGGGYTFHESDISIGNRNFQISTGIEVMLFKGYEEHTHLPGGGALFGRVRYKNFSAKILSAGLVTALQVGYHFDM